MSDPLLALEAAIVALEAALPPLLLAVPSLPPTLPPLANAKLHAGLAQAGAALLAAFLRLSGVDTAAHPVVAAEFAALQRLGRRIRTVEGIAAAAGEVGGGGEGAAAASGAAPQLRLDAAAAARFVRAALEAPLLVEVETGGVDAAAAGVAAAGASGEAGHSAAGKRRRASCAEEGGDGGEAGGGDKDATAPVEKQRMLVSSKRSGEQRVG